MFPLFLSNLTMSVSVVDWAERMEPFLARRVPDGEAHPGVGHNQLLHHEGGLQCSMVTLLVSCSQIQDMSLTPIEAWTW